MKSDILFTLPISDENDLSNVNSTVALNNELCRGCGRELSADDVVMKENRKPRRKRILKKIIHFFTTVVKPILIFVPNFINALANLKKVMAPIS